MTPTLSAELTEIAAEVEDLEAASILEGARARRRWLGEFLVMDHRMEPEAAAVFAGHWTHLTQVVVLAPALEVATLACFEAFFSGYRALTTIHAADPFSEAVATLQRCGYRLLGEAWVMGLAEAPATGRAEVRVEAGSSRNEWIRTASAGFLCREPANGDDLEIGGVAACMENTTRYLARVDGVAAASAALHFHGDAAILFCDSTLHGYRGRGLHRELIRARVRQAVGEGARRVVATVQPHSGSARNYETCGFRKLYSRLTFRKP